MVVLYHLQPVGVIAGLPLVRNGWLFVDFFFVLSGFVIATSYGDRLASGFGVARFMGLRLGRVYPVHLLMLAILLLFETSSWLGQGQPDGRQEFTGRYTLADLGLDALLLQCFGLRDHLSWNIVAWSIAAEVWTYLLFAWVMRCAGRLNGMIFAGLALAALMLVWFRSDTFLDTGYDLGFVRCVYGFSLGVLVKMARERWSVKVNGVVESGVALLLIAYLSLSGRSNWTYLAPPIFALVVFIFAAEAGIISRILRLSLFRLLGKLSYAIYMFHLFALARYFDLVGGVDRAIGFVLPADIQTIAALPFVALLAWPVWRFVEMPARRWSRQRLAQA